ncbi:CoA pyrophosphatase [Nocardioides sp. zg-536]|uniref:CoA pyrophosphatase n=1 Tax=Nocardioides faecalis TaxID=2803858 RepID=A0A938Y832_9ACTN|nr:CoA pyrophosphatase [Nocardioides faecalis]MBM9461015.1 CoA pyrophosphatase [Nocardioides faecalis]MBS4752079.1 CoA pyrophosphatase [Nocardioides faecalis]QVI59108.1 CoA pyrophosphatase [Nocardioides faecalis]
MNAPLPEDIRAALPTSVPATAPDGLPEWLVPLAQAARAIQGSDLSQFLPPEGAPVRRGAVLMLFSENAEGDGDVLLTERAHHMRSHPGQVSFPGGSIDPGETTVQAALREAWEEIGVDPRGVEVFAELPELWLPPSNFAVTPILGWWREPGGVRVASPDEVHAIHRVALRELFDPAHRIAVRHPGGWTGPGFLIGEDKDVILWGFTGGILTRFFTFLGWLPGVEDPPVHDLPDHMLGEYRRRTGAVATDESPRDSMDILEPDE